jgi:hypothetical protein
MCSKINLVPRQGGQSHFAAWRRVTTLLLHGGKVTEPLRSELIRYLGEVCILFRTAWEHRRSRDPLIDDVGALGGGVCPKAAGASRWWEFVGLRVGVATNVGGSVYIVERHDVKGFRGKFALWAHHDHVNSRKPEFKTSLERRQAVKPNLQTIGLGQTD